MGTPRVQHPALPSPAPSRCGTESLWHRVAVAPSASPITCARAKSNPGSVAAGAATRGRRPGPRPAATPHNGLAHSSRAEPRGRVPSGREGALKPAEPQQAAVASPCTSTPAAATRPTNQTASPAPLSLRTQRLGTRGAHDAPPRPATSCAAVLRPRCRNPIVSHRRAAQALSRAPPGRASRPTRRSRARGSEASPLGGAGGAPRRSSRRGSGCYAARPSSGGLPRPLGTAGSRRRGRTCPRAHRRRAPGWGRGRRP